MSDVFEKYIKSDGLKFKHAKGMRDIIGKEFHTYNEILLFLGDEAKFISEHIKQPLAPNTLVIIPKERFHQFHISGPDENYHRCVLNFVDIPQYEQLIKEVLCDVYLIPEITDETAQLFSKLCRTAESDSSEYERQILLYAVLAELLIEIKENLKLKRNTKVCEGTVNPFTAAALEYIDENAEGELKLGTLSAHLHISPSYLSHIFKKDLHISVYSYILKKKLVLANNKINSGIPPMQAAAQCGFKDYSGFYKMYKKEFGISPVKKIKTLRFSCAFPPSLHNDNNFVLVHCIYPNIFVQFHNNPCGVLAYPAEVRRIIYTTNIIEGLNRQFRSITKTKPSFTNDDSLRKMLYLASKKTVEHWTARCRNWDQVLNQLHIQRRLHYSCTARCASLQPNQS